MRIYLTGIAGLLAGNLAYLFKDKYEVYGCDRNKAAIPNTVSSAFDLLDFDALKNDILKASPRVLVHCAALVNVDGCEKDPAQAERMNAGLTRFLSELCAKQNIKLVYISTDAVFDGESAALYREDDAVNPVNIYGQTKLDGEHEVLLHPQNLVLRTNIYGFNLRVKKSFGEWILYALLNNETLNMFQDISFSPILVNEFARILDLAVETDLSGLFHLCGTGAISKYDFGVALQREFQLTGGKIVKAKSTDFQLLAKRSPHMGMSNEKIKAALNTKIDTPMESIQKFKLLYDAGYPAAIRT